MEFTKDELIILKYGLALASEEICNNINKVTNKVNNLKLLSEYKKQLITIQSLSDKLVK